ncbi:MAG: hypothetical protein M0Z35_07160 [Desulfitobacterium hafniense]|nr:hypothetical protein [Desulfitobacterium hafniense]
MNLERKRKQECKDANCGLTKERCLKFLGKDCIKNGGTKIPLQSATQGHVSALMVEAQTTFKPYFIVDGRAMDDWRDDL